MQNFGVGIMYLVLGLAQYKFVDRLHLKTNIVSLNIGKTFYYTGFIITGASLASMLPFVSDWVSIIALIGSVCVLCVLCIKSVREFKQQMKYSYFYFVMAAREENKEVFEEGFAKYPNVICADMEGDLLFRYLAENGNLEKWLGDKKHHFSPEIYKMYSKYRIRALYNQPK